MSTRRTPAGVLASSTRSSRRARSTCSQLSAHSSLTRSPASVEGRDDRAVARHGPLGGAVGVVDGGRFGDVELGGDRLPCLARRAHADDPAAQLVASVPGRWSSLPAASTSDIASSSSRPYFFSRRTSSRRSSPSAGLRASSPSRTARARISESRCRCELIVCGRSGCIARPRPSIERLADCQRCLDPAVLCELSVEVGLDVAARQFAHDDVAEVRQQVDLELALHVSQAVRAQSLSDFALVVLVGELRDGRDFAVRRSRPSAAGSRSRRGSGWRSAVPRVRHVHDSCPRRCARGGSVSRRVAAAAEPHAVAHDAVAEGELADLPGRLAGHTSETATGEGERATRPLRSRPPALAGRAPTGALAAEWARRRSAARRHEGCAAARSAPVPSLTAPSSAACS